MGIWEITEPWQEMLKSFQDKPCDIDDIQSDKRKQERLAVRLALKHLAGSEMNINYTENGAPVLQNSPYSISISHTTGYAAVILSKKPYPGIDIEYRSERAWKLRTKYLGENELEMFASSEKLQDDDKLPEKADHATICWCAKETAFKALQQTEVDFIKHLHIEPFTLSKSGILKLKETKTPQLQTFDINFEVTENYIITWKA